MTRAEDTIRAAEGSRGGSVLRWTLAASVMLAVHGAGAWAILRTEPLPEEAAGAPEAPILIDLAPPAAAPEIASLDAEAGPEVVDAPEEEPVEEPTPEPEPVEPPPEVSEPKPEPEVVEEPEPEPEVVEEPEPEVVEEEPEPEPEPTPPEPPVETEAAAVLNAPVPTRRPEPPVRRVEREEPPEPEPPHRERPREPAEPQRQARQAPPPSAASQGQQQRQASQGAQVSRAAQASWQQQVQARLNRAKRTPRGGGSGTAQVSFVMNGGGAVVSVRLVGSAGNPVLDQAAVALVQRASPFPAPPGGQQISLTVPIRFD